MFGTLPSYNIGLSLDIFPRIGPAISFALPDAVTRT